MIMLGHSDSPLGLVKDAERLESRGYDFYRKWLGRAIGSGGLDLLKYMLDDYRQHRNYFAELEELFMAGELDEMPHLERNDFVVADPESSYHSESTQEAESEVEFLEEALGNELDQVSGYKDIFESCQGNFEKQLFSSVLDIKDLHLRIVGERLAALKEFIARQKKKEADSDGA